jgi:L-threonylcarbamoyladenylate synthase
MREIEASWPGPHTWLLPAAAGVPRWLRGDHVTLAVRVTAHPLAAALCRAFGGPLVSTSANRSGRPAALSPLQVRLRCPGVDLVLHGALGGRAGPSRIRDGATGRLIRG